MVNATEVGTYRSGMGNSPDPSTVQQSNSMPHEQQGGVKPNSSGSNGAPGNTNETNANQTASTPTPNGPNNGFIPLQSWASQVGESTPSFGDPTDGDDFGKSGGKGQEMSPDKLPVSDATQTNTYPVIIPADRDNISETVVVYGEKVQLLQPLSDVEFIFEKWWNGGPKVYISELGVSVIVDQNGYATGIAPNCGVVPIPSQATMSIVGSIGNLKHLAKHLPEFLKLNPKTTLDGLVRLAKFIAKPENMIKATNDGKIFQKIVNIGGKNLLIEVRENISGIKTIFIRH